MRTVPLASGGDLPAIALGLYKVDRDDTERVVRVGLDLGYRVIDGADFYGNHVELGRAVRASGMRDETIVTTKFWGDPEQSARAVVADLDEAERALGMPFDCLMIHWPRAPRDRYVETWQAMRELRDAGRVRLIGVANFAEPELRRLHDETGEWPAINQVESHPWLPQHELRSFHAEHGIVTQSWSSLGRGRLLHDPTLEGLAARHRCTVAQLVLAWHLRLGGAAAVKSTHEQRLAENLDLDDIRISMDDLTEIAALESGERTGTHPRDRP